MHCKIMDDVLERYRGKLWRYRLTLGCALSGSIGAIAVAAMVSIAASYCIDYSPSLVRLFLPLKQL